MYTSMKKLNHINVVSVLHVIVEAVASVCEVSVWVNLSLSSFQIMRLMNFKFMMHRSEKDHIICHLLTKFLIGFHGANCIAFVIASPGTTRNPLYYPIKKKTTFTCPYRTFPFKCSGNIPSMYAFYFMRYG